MKRINIIIIATMALSIGTYFFFTNRDFNQFIKKNILGEKKPTDNNSIFEVYCIADGTYSVNTDYAIPQIDKDFIEKMIDSIHLNGSGKFWLSYIDKDSKNNKNLYFSIPATVKTEPHPKERSGESTYDYINRVKKWESNISKYEKDSVEKETSYIQKKQEFLNKCDSMLKNVVYIKSNDNKFSDVIGTLNSAFKSLSGNSDVNIRKYVIAFSDLQQDTPNLKQLPELEEIPEKVILISTNPAPGSTNRCTEEVEELDSPERVFETIFK